MTLTTRRKTAAGGLLAATLLCGALAFNTPSASAADDRAPSTVSGSSSGSATAGPGGVTFSGGAVDLNGKPVESRTYVGDTPPTDLGKLQCSATVNVDGTVTDKKGDCDGLRAAAG